MKGADELRACAEWTRWQNEDFNDRFTTEELLKLYRYARQHGFGEGDVPEFADSWTEEQIAEALIEGRAEQRKRIAELKGPMKNTQDHPVYKCPTEKRLPRDFKPGDLVRIHTRQARGQYGGALIRWERVVKVETVGMWTKVFTEFGREIRPGVFEFGSVWDFPSDEAMRVLSSELSEG